jgi:hypothetical protein
MAPDIGVKLCGGVFLLPLLLRNFALELCNKGRNTIPRQFLKYVEYFFD